MKKINPLNHEWYLLKIKSEYDSQSFSPSGYCICEYVDGLFFEEQSEQSINDYKYEIIKHLKQKD